MKKILSSVVLVAALLLSLSSRVIPNFGGNQGGKGEDTTLIYGKGVKTDIVISINAT